MEKAYLARLGFAGLLLVVAIVFAGTPALTATGTINSTVTIATPISITGDSDLVFGVFTAPTSGTDSWALDESIGTLTKTGGTGDSEDLFPTDHQRGGFTVSGEPNAGVTYSAAVTSNFADANLSLTSVGLNPTSPQNLDGSGNLILGVGGTLDISAGAASGSHSATIELTANY